MLVGILVFLEGLVIGSYLNVCIECFPKCRDDQVTLLLRYPLIELVTGILFTCLYLKYGFSVNFFKWALIFSSLIVIALIDFKYMIIPDKFVLFILAISFIFSFQEGISFKESLRGLICGGGILFIFSLLGLMGAGDYKLMGSIGFGLGVSQTLLAELIASYIGAFIGVLAIILKVQKKRQPIPFGPYLAVGTFFSVLYG